MLQFTAHSGKVTTNLHYHPASLVTGKINIFMLDINDQLSTNIWNQINIKSAKY